LFSVYDPTANTSKYYSKFEKLQCEDPYKGGGILPKLLVYKVKVKKNRGRVNLKSESM